MVTDAVVSSVNCDRRWNLSAEISGEKTNDDCKFIWNIHWLIYGHTWWSRFSKLFADNLMQQLPWSARQSRVLRLYPLISPTSFFSAKWNIFFVFCNIKLFSTVFSAISLPKLINMWPLVAMVTMLLFCLPSLCPVTLFSLKYKSLFIFSHNRQKWNTRMNEYD